MNLNELKKNELKKKFETKVGLINYSLSDNELKQIISAVQLVAPSKRNIAKIQSIVTVITGQEVMMRKEAFDNSDIDDIIAQIQRALGKESKANGG